MCGRDDDPSTYTQPKTSKGRALFTDNEPFDMWESVVTPEDICEVERQAIHDSGLIAKNVALEAALKEALRELALANGRIGELKRMFSETA